MASIFAGVVLLVICGILLIVRRSQQNKLFDIMATETSTVQQLADSAKYVAERMGETGNFNQITEIKGVIRCDSPITSEIARQSCVYYSMSVSREYEETYWEEDSQTKQRVSKTRRSSEVVASNSQRIPFFVEDATGRVLVEPSDADVDAMQVVDRFEPEEATIALGALQIDLGGLLPLGSGRRTTGYKIKESILPLDRQVYVLGEAVDSEGKLRIHKPRENGKRFLISLKSEEELIRSTGSTIRWLLVAAIGSGALGAVLTVVGLIRR